MTPKPKDKQPKRKRLKATSDNPRPNHAIAQEARRAFIFGYMMRGLTVGEIAAAVHKSRRTVINDMNVIKRDWRESVDNAQISELKGRTLAEVQSLLAEAMGQFDVSDKGGLKAQFLDKALRAWGYKAKFMLDVNLIPKAPSGPMNQFNINAMLLSGENAGDMDLLELDAMENKIRSQLKTVEAVPVNALPEPALSGDKVASTEMSKDEQ